MKLELTSVFIANHVMRVPHKTCHTNNTWKDCCRSIRWNNSTLDTHMEIVISWSSDISMEKTSTSTHESHYGKTRLPLGRHHWIMDFNQWANLMPVLKIVCLDLSSRASSKSTSVTQVRPPIHPAICLHMSKALYHCMCWNSHYTLIVSE